MAHVFLHVFNGCVNTSPLLGTREPTALPTTTQTIGRRQPPHHPDDRPATIHCPTTWPAHRPSAAMPYLPNHPPTTTLTTAPICHSPYALPLDHSGPLQCSASAAVLPLSLCSALPPLAYNHCWHTPTLVCHHVVFHFYFKICQQFFTKIQGQPLNF